MFESYAEIFEQRAGAYHAAMKTWPRARDAEFRAVLEPLQDAVDGIVCDMPSGGNYLAEYLRPGMKYLGIDPADGFVEESANERTSDTVRAAIVDVPLPDNSVDYVVSLAGLHHEASLPRVFTEMHRLVRPNGRLVIADVAVDTPPARFLNGFVADNNPRGHDGRFLDGQTRGFLEAVGFTVVQDQLIDVPWLFDDIHTAGEFCAALFGISLLGPAAVSQAMADEIGFDAVDGALHLKWTLRRIVCDLTQANL